MDVPYTYCPRCASRMEPQTVHGKTRPVCPSCGLIIFLNPGVVAAVIPVLDGKIALVRRAMKPRRGAWVFPGGYVDQGEGVDEAAVREAWEETGLQVRLDRLLGVYSRNGDDNVLVVYAGTVIGGALTSGEEELEAAWFSPADLPPASELGFWSTVKALEDWKQM